MDLVRDLSSWRELVASVSSLEVAKKRVRSSESSFVVWRFAWWSSPFFLFSVSISPFSCSTSELWDYASQSRWCWSCESVLCSESHCAFYA